MAKESFSSIQQVNKKGLMKKAVIIGGILIAVIAAATAIHMIGQNRKDNSVHNTEVPVPQPVPSSIRYYDPQIEETYQTGTDYIIMNQSNGNMIRVMQDGSVYLLDGNGNVIREITGTEREGIINDAIDLADLDSQVRIALSGIEDTIEPEEEPTAQDIRNQQEADTIQILEDEYDMTIDDFYRIIYDQGLTPSKYYELLSEGADMDQLIASAAAFRSDAEEENAAEESANQGMAADIGGASIEGDMESPIEYPDWMQMPDLTSGMQASLDSLSSAVAASSQQPPSAEEERHERVNGNQNQREWLEEHQNVPRTVNKIDDMCLTAGTVVPITLITGIDTDLPGEVIGQVRQNVYDSLTGSNILIPKGTRLIADYNDSVAFGQKRVQIAWREMITPDGYVFSLPGFQGVTGEGYSGVRDKYTSHFWEILGGAFLGSVINLGTGYVREQTELASNLMGTDALSLIASGVLDTSENLGEKYIDLIMDREPTIRIRAGFQTQLLVNQTIDLRRE